MGSLKVLGLMMAELTTELWFETKLGNEYSYHDSGTNNGTLVKSGLLLGMDLLHMGAVQW